MGMIRGKRDAGLGGFYMTLLLVDDEFHVRKKLQNKVDWNALGIDVLLEADDGDRKSVV